MIGLLYWVVYGAGWLQLRRGVERAARPVRLTWWGAALWLTVAVPSCLQFGWPALLTGGERVAADIEDGEWWRLLTSLVLQDGGWPGTVSNLVVLAVTVLLTGALVRAWLLPVLFLVGGAVCNVLTVLTFADSGAGNSMATMVLLVVVVVWCMRRTGPDLAIGALLVAIAVVLLLRQDMHGLAVALGLLLGAVSRRRAALNLLRGTAPASRE